MKNPVKGGSPPKDNNGIKMIVLVKFLKFKIEKICVKLNSLKLLKIKITDKDRRQ